MGGSGVAAVWLRVRGSRGGGRELGHPGTLPSHTAALRPRVCLARLRHLPQPPHGSGPLRVDVQRAAPQPASMLWLLRLRTTARWCQQDGRTLEPERPVCSVCISRLFESPMLCVSVRFSSP
jgi:hypothetical protein